MSPDLVLEVLRAYPQIYHACHLEHARARSNVNRISARDAFILGHLDTTRPMRPPDLARHLGLRASTVSEAVARLERLGYVARRAATQDRRRIELTLLPRGVEALKGASILDAGRVERLLAQLPAKKRKAAIAGLSLLAHAARSLMTKEPKKWNHGDEG